MTHKNSLAAYQEGCKFSFKSRAQSIFEVLYFGRKELSDREVLKKLKPGSDNINFVQPRLSEMLKSGVLEECGTKRENGRPVRVCRIKQDKPQQVSLL